jgi:RNA polymerase sigma-70 factor (ECF subfamily)
LGGNAHDAEDACHETILRAYRALPRFRPGAMWPWLATIAANICVDMTKKRARTIWLDDDRLDSRRDEPWAEGPEDEAARRARVMVIREALTQLPDRYRAVVRMRDYDGWSYREMAEFLGTSVAAVESLLVRARRALRGHVSRRLAGAAS